MMPYTLERLQKFSTIDTRETREKFEAACTHFFCYIRKYRDELSTLALENQTGFSLVNRGQSTSLVVTFKNPKKMLSLEAINPRVIGYLQGVKVYNTHNIELLLTD